MQNNDTTTTLETLKQRLKQFRDERNWKKFHTPKDLAISMSIEVHELLELFVWQKPDEIKKRLNQKEFSDRVAEEFGDIAMNLFCLANCLGLDITKTTLEKLEKTKLRYPIEQFNSNIDAYVAAKIKKNK